ncbi:MULTISPECIES: transglycosylase domain-containing protein [unclassified Ensifer]|uniref:transglycosylase domain-containing protein n=1 Tax=unclassified Ensifer TaxID=2633371 RepID=UPI00081379C2|nr:MULTISPECIES: transglycosylase domain-containing protein [unclassified Ensifer]OCO98760.1 penicillin-binding protein [Ensifer sp. LC14]OCP13239.1 penicillin-binding protein [Ensifer sp. LC13]OCP13841.1 penicillin-binding protein [Ensifer sp. LC11]OCP28220.1 penicillin-binding protein [Ensifer sp. LC499]
MAPNGRSGQRIEPSFGRDEDDDDDFRVEASDRVTASRKAAPRGKPPGKSKKKTATGKRGGSRRGGGGGFIGLVRTLFYWCIVLGIWGAIGVGGLVLYYGARMPSAESWSIPDRPPNVKILSVAGDIIANRGTTGGEALSLENMSPYIPQAVIAIEDRRFYSHFGIDPLGLARAMLTNVTTGRMVQGGSTLTQQLAKNLFLSPERTLERKVQEVLLAFWLEQKYSKDQILAMYLNRVFFGSNAYGVEAASRRYFNKSARDVNLGEAAVLAGLLKAPSRLSPARDPKAAEERAQIVLGAMREEGYVTDGEIKTAMSQTPTKAKSYWSGAEHYVADMVMDQLPGMIGEIKEDLIIDTTIDLNLEKKAEEVISATLDGDGKKLDASQAALVSIDGTGAIRALVGGKDYAESQFDRASKAKRQPGSAFKPFVYAAALEIGRTPMSIRNDGPVRIGNWTPENYDQKYRGEVTIADALANSLNTIAAQLVMEVGPANVVKVAHRLGIDSEMQANASIALGTSEVSLVELTSAYAPFMNGGFKATPHVIRRISKADGTVLYENTYDNPPRVLDPAVVSEMNQMMVRVLTKGTGKKAQLKGWEAAGKTGTTQSFRDALFVGYTSNLTTGVWFGNDDGKSMKKVTGGGLPAKAWHDFMMAAHEGLSPSPLFGTTGVQPVFDEGVQTPPGDMMSGDPEAFPEAPVGVDGAVAVGQRPIDQGGDQWGGQGTDQGNGGLVPPADVGETTGATRRTTLFDILTGG